MKNYKFRLEGLLKLRKFKEHQQKIELAQINREISDIDQRILEAKADIKTAYASMEQALKDGSEGQMAQFYPRYIQAKRDFIENSIEAKQRLLVKYEASRKQLAIKRGEAQVIEKMKEKDMDKERKKYLKKLDSAIEDILQAQRAHKKSQIEKGA